MPRRFLFLVLLAAALALAPVGIQANASPANSPAGHVGHAFGPFSGPWAPPGSSRAPGASGFRATAITSPPSIDLSVGVSTLWPPNHKLVSAELSLDVTDAYDPDPTVVLTVCSDEPDDATGNGDGHTTGDAEIVLGSGSVATSPGKECVSVKMSASKLAEALKDVRIRAERDGAGTGRTYRIQVVATSSTGSESTATAEIFVPHDKGK